MKRHILDFLRRGLTALGLGPLVLAVIYQLLHSRGLVEVLTVREVCTLQDHYRASNGLRYVCPHPGWL